MSMLSKKDSKLSASIIFHWLSGTYSRGSKTNLESYSQRNNNFCLNKYGRLQGKRCSLNCDLSDDHHFKRTL